MRPCTAAARCGPTSCSTARRAISCRNRSTVPSATSEPGGDRFVEGVGVGPGHVAEQVGLDPLADEGGRVEHVAAGGGEARGPGEDRVAGRRGQLARVGAQHLAHEERVAGRERLHGGRLVAGPVAQRGDRRRRQGRQRDPARRALAGGLAEGLAQGAVLGEPVVAVRRHDQRPDGAQAARQVTDQVEGRLVGEVQVLQHEHREAPVVTVLAQRRRAGRRSGCRGGPLGARHPDGAAPLVGDVLQRPQGGRRERAVAGAPRHPRSSSRASTNASTRLDLPIPASPETSTSRPSPAAGVGGVVAERSELELPLEERHAPSVGSEPGSRWPPRPCARCGRCRRRTGNRRPGPTPGSAGGCGPRRRPPRAPPSGPRRR